MQSNIEYFNKLQRKYIMYLFPDFTFSCF